MKLPIDRIRTDGGTQPREAVDRCVVDDYASAMKRGDQFPPVVVFHDGADYWLADGFIRRDAIQWRGLKEIDCEIRQGTLEDAQWYSYSANQAHGLRRTTEDKQRAVKAALAHPKGAGMSDRDIARHVGVGHSMVSELRAELTPSVRIGQIETPTVTVKRKGKTYQMKPRRKRAVEVELEEEPEKKRSPRQVKTDQARLGARELFSRARHLVELIDWLIDRRHFEEAHRDLERSAAALNPIIEEIERMAVAEDRNNRSRLHIG